MPKRNLKILLLGDSSVGKTSLMNAFATDKFSALYRPTIGADFLCKDVILPNKNVVKVQIWDTAGQEQWFQQLGSAYYRGTDAVILVYDCTNQKSLQNLDTWRNDFLQNSGAQNIQTFPFGVFGNKSDLTDQISVSEARGANFAEARGNNFQFFSVSAKTIEGVENGFVKICEMAIERERGAKDEEEAEDFQIEEVGVVKGGKKGCC